MNKLIAGFIFSILMTGCGILDTKEQTEIISEKSCKNTCLMKNKSYQGYDKEIGCLCGVK